MYSTYLLSILDKHNGDDSPQKNFGLSSVRMGTVPKHVGAK